MRYLLDELTAYEEGFTDILMPDQGPERHETFMGTAPSCSSSQTPVSKADLDTLQANIIRQVDLMLTPQKSRLIEHTPGGVYFTPNSGMVILYRPVFYS